MVQIQRKKKYHHKKTSGSHNDLNALRNKKKNTLKELVEAKGQSEGNSKIIKRKKCQCWLLYPVKNCF